MLWDGCKVAEVAQVLQIVYLATKLGVGEDAVQLVQVQVPADRQQMLKLGRAHTVLCTC